MKVRKSTINFVIEGVTLAVLAGLISTGVIMEFVLPPGSGSHGASVLSLTRHDWGAVHFYLGAGFFVLLVLHLYLHWRWIWAMAKGRESSRRKIRGAAFLGISGVFVALLAAPFVLPVKEGGTGQGNRFGSSGFRSAGESDHGDGLSGESEMFLRGRDTIRDAAALYGLTVEEAKRRLDLPPSVGADERLGPTVREFGLEMDEVRRRLGN